MAIICEDTVPYLPEKAPQKNIFIAVLENDNLRFFSAIHLTENHIYIKKTFRGGSILFCPKVYVQDFSRSN
jgi:hypothetical protein